MNNTFKAQILEYQRNEITEAHIYVCLACTLVAALGIIAMFNYYIAVAKDLNFTGRFLEMAGLSMSVATLSFLVGFVLRAFFGIEV